MLALRGWESLDAVTLIASRRTGIQVMRREVNKLYLSHQLQTANSSTAESTGCEPRRIRPFGTTYS
jgi:hypothetical protein